MQFYSKSLTHYARLITSEVNVGGLLIGNGHPIRLQTMTTTDTMDTIATVEQSIRCIEAGAELIRITAPSKNEAENLLNIKNELRKRGYNTPIVADIHFTPNAAEIAARIVEKVRINPGNYVDKKKFEQIEYTDAEYAEEIERIAERFTPLVQICKEYGTAMRIGTNHGSLSDRIMSRYGDTPMGMVESAMEFLRIAREENYHNIILSMKASNPQVMVQAYRLLVKQMYQEFEGCYPLHLGVTEAGDGEDGRVKSAIGIGTLLEDGIGDTIRVSLTEDPELEIPVCKDLVKRYYHNADHTKGGVPSLKSLNYDPFQYTRRNTLAVNNIGHQQVPIVIADLSKLPAITKESLASIGYTYDAASDKWNIAEAAADYVFAADKPVHFSLPSTLTAIIPFELWLKELDKTPFLPLVSASEYVLSRKVLLPSPHFVMIECYSESITRPTHPRLLKELKDNPNAILCLYSTNKNNVQSIRRFIVELEKAQIKNPVIIHIESNWKTPDEHLIHYATEAGAIFLDGLADGISLGITDSSYQLQKEGLRNTSGRNYASNTTPEQFINSTAFSILQATRTRISKTEYISCPSCGRTLFDLQETTAKIRAVTNHLKGVKIAIMGCVVNGPGEMADADFGYVGSGVGKITLYKGKEVVKKNIDSNIAVDELILLLKESNVWVEPIV